MNTKFRRSVPNQAIVLIMLIDRYRGRKSEGDESRACLHLQFIWEKLICRIEKVSAYGPDYPLSTSQPYGSCLSDVQSFSCAAWQNPPVFYINMKTPIPTYIAGKH